MCVSISESGVCVCVCTYMYIGQSVDICSLLFVSLELSYPSHCLLLSAELLSYVLLLHSTEKM